MPTDEHPLEGAGGDDKVAHKLSKKQIKNEHVLIVLGLLGLIVTVLVVRKSSSSSSTSASALAAAQAQGASQQASLDQASMASQGTASGGYGGTYGGGYSDGSGGTDYSALETSLTDLANQITSLQGTQAAASGVAPVNITVNPVSAGDNSGGTSGSGAVATQSSSSGSSSLSAIQALDKTFVPTTEFMSGGTEWYGVGNAAALTALKKADPGVTVSTAKAIGVPGGSTTADYVS